MALNWPSKAPGELLDYGINWSQELVTDTIVSSTWSISPSDLVNDHSTNQAQSATLWLSGGTVNETYACFNQITTAAGRIFDQTVNIRIANK